MVRFSQTLDDKQSKSRGKPYEQREEIGYTHNLLDKFIVKKIFMLNHKGWNRQKWSMKGQ